MWTHQNISPICNSSPWTLTCRYNISRSSCFRLSTRCWELAAEICSRSPVHRWAPTPGTECAGWGAGFCFCCQLTVRAHPEPTAGGPRGNSRWILEKVQWIKIVYCPFKVGGNVCATLWRTWTVIWRFSYNICTMKTLTNITYALDNKTEIWLDNTNRRIIPLAKYRIISIMATEHTFRKVSYIYV